MRARTPPPRQDGPAFRVASAPGRRDTFSNPITPVQNRPLDHGFISIAAVSPRLRLADPAGNVPLLESALSTAAEQGASLVLLPELCLTGYSCGDLFNQETLLRESNAALHRLAAFAGKLGVAAVVGLPVADGGRLFNGAAFLADGKIVGIVPKTHLPNTGEFYEQRWFASARVWDKKSVLIDDLEVPMGADLLFRAANFPECVVGLEICEDLWSVEPPSGAQSLAGATLLLNPSASDELLGKARYRRDLVAQQSARCMAAYAYASAGANESSTDLVYGGHCLVAENGAVLGESERFLFGDSMVISQVDVQRLNHERRRNSTYFGAKSATSFRTLDFMLGVPFGATPKLKRRFSPHPFVPADTAARDEHCREIFSIQATGLARRIRHTHAKHLVLGLSGGLDSALALLVTVEALDRLGIDRKGLVCVTMPGPGTTERTKNNALKLAELLGVTLREIPIDEAVALHLRDIGHPEGQHDVTFENVQARERTQILMNVAGALGGFVVGTGDLSEAALGWCTFNGDHISMYHVNIGVPKTLVRHLVTWAAHARYVGEARTVLEDVVATPVSPELLPPAADGTIAQETELIVGPYDLHDFFLYHTVRNGFRPRKTLWLAEHAFAGKYDEATLRKWLKLFLRRFFTQQFKRNVMPEGPKVGSVALSPRGDWRMPGDAFADAWLRELE